MIEPHYVTQKYGQTAATPPATTMCRLAFPYTRGRKSKRKQPLSAVSGRTAGSRNNGLEKMALEHILLELKLQGGTHVTALLSGADEQETAVFVFSGFRPAGRRSPQRAVNYYFNFNRLEEYIMKKKVVGIFCLMLSCLVLTGCSQNSEPFEIKTYTPDVQVQGVRLDVKDRVIEVALSPDDQVHLQYAENSKEYYEISLSAGNVLTVTSAVNKEWTNYIGGKPAAEDRTITVQVPDGLLNRLTVFTTNEDINLPALAVTGSVTLSSNGGSVNFGCLSVGNRLTLNAKNGNITGAIVGSYDDFAIQTNLKKGESNLPDAKEGGEKTLDVTCNNGDVEISFVEG